jgi:hypothetical protein
MNFLIKQFNLNSFIYIKEAKDKIKKKMETKVHNSINQNSISSYRLNQNYKNRLHHYFTPLCDLKKRTINNYNSYEKDRENYNNSENLSSLELNKIMFRRYIPSMKFLPVKKIYLTTEVSTPKKVTISPSKSQLDIELSDDRSKYKNIIKVLQIRLRKEIKKNQELAYHIKNEKVRYENNLTENIKKRKQLSNYLVNKNIEIVNLQSQLSSVLNDSLIKRNYDKERKDMSNEINSLRMEKDTLEQNYLSKIKDLGLTIKKMKNENEGLRKFLHKQSKIAKDKIEKGLFLSPQNDKKNSGKKKDLKFSEKEFYYILNQLIDIKNEVEELKRKNQDLKEKNEKLEKKVSTKEIIQNKSMSMPPSNYDEEFDLKKLAIGA